GWGLAEAGSDIHAPSAQGIVERRLQQYSGANVELMGWLATAMQVTLRWQGYPDQAAVVLGIGRFGDHPDAQFPMLRQPGP
ncbi:hypothetical protein C0043_04565, partial [Pseudomonas aeruginosa]